MLRLKFCYSFCVFVFSVITMDFAEDVVYLNVIGIWDRTIV